MKFGCIGWLLAWLWLTPALAAVTETCTVCAEPLPESVYLVPDHVAGDKKKVCSQCAVITKICYLCGLPVKREVTELSDGRILCARDVKSVVLDEAEARRICHETKEAMDRQFSRFISFPDTNITVAIADRVSLLAFFRMPGNDYECPNVMGFIQSRTNRTRVQHEISVMNGLLPGVLRATYAHECTHAWLTENLSDERASRISRDSAEGFCELVAYLTCGALGNTKAQEIITRNAYTRGQVGLLIEAEQRYGFNEIVDWVKNGEDSRLVAGEVERVRRVRAASWVNEERRLPVATAAASAPTLGLPRQTAANELVLQGIVWSAARSLASINNRSFAPGEEAKIILGGSNVTIRCLEIRRDAVVVQRVGAEAPVELKLPPQR